jgi:nitrogen fixation protein NifQ
MRYNALHVKKKKGRIMDTHTLYSHVRMLLEAHARDAVALREIAPLVARRSLEMNHLYEAMGFANRGQMGKFMSEHFPALASQKPANVRWKKFLYDSIQAIAPACEGCPDAEDCFNAECSLEWHKR